MANTVKINQDRVEEVGKEIQQSGSWDNPSDDVFGVALYELIASSINYCYWYGNSSIRPNEASSAKMYEFLTLANDGCNIRPYDPCYHSRIINRFIDEWSDVGNRQNA